MSSLFVTFEIGAAISMDFCTSSTGPNLGKMWGMHPPAVFEKVYDEHNFSIILNLFCNNMSYVSSTHKIKCTNEMHHIR